MKKPIFIIGEIGINHNGDISICKQLIDVAVNSGCNAIKLQKRDVDLVYSKEILDSPRESPWGLTQRDQKNGLEFNVDQYHEIDQYCKKVNIEWFASAWDTKSQIFLRQFDCNYNKVASAMIIHTELLKLIAEEKKYTFISTGMATYSDIDAAVKIFIEAGCSFELMHTVSTYPMRYEDANLSVIKVLRDRYKCNIGYSGHEVGLTVSYAATALGITSLERHITMGRAMYGSDQSASVEPQGIAKLVVEVRKIELAMGDGVKRILDDEVLISKKLREQLN
jgi:N-acetylneuraminate synthase